MKKVLLAGILAPLALFPAVALAQANPGQPVNIRDASGQQTCIVTNPCYVDLGSSGGGPLPPGTNIIGKVGIDQTTPGVTNGVVVNSSATPTAPVAVRLTLTASAVQLGSSALTNGVIFYIPSTDTGTVCVGPAGVTTTTGYCMSVASGVVAGSLGVNNTNLIYVIGTNTSDTIEFLGN